MTYSPAIRTAVQLTAEARAAAQVQSTGYGLAVYLPDNDNYGLSFNFDVNATALTEVASYRSFNTEADFGEQGGGASRSGKLPPISRKYRVDEFEQLSLYGQNDALGAELERYARRAGAAIAARVELARGEAIEKGTVTLAERNLQFTIDYGRKSSHTIIAPAIFTNAASQPVDVLDSAAAVYRASTGANPARTLTSGRVFAALQKNTEIIKLALGRGSDLVSRVSVDDVRSVLASYGYGDISIFDEVVGSQRVISDDKIIFLPSAGSTLDGGALGTTDWGIPAESINPTYGIPESDRPGIFAGHFTQTDPEGSNVLGSAIVLPILRNADATMAIKVL